MSSAPLVSVIMPAYNVAEFVGAAIASALRQSMPDLELIVVDDASSDDTAHIAESSGDPRVRVVRAVHGGSSAARNRGLALASGSYVAFLDGDDLWAPDKLQRHLDVMTARPDLDLTFGWSAIIDESGRPTGRTSARVQGRVTLRQLLVENVVNNGSAAVLRRDALGAAGWFDESLAAAVEYDVWLRIAALRPGNIECIPELLSSYRMRSGQITRDWRRMERAWLALREKTRAYAPDEVGATDARSRAQLYRYLAYIAYESGEQGDGRRLLLTALRASPLTMLRDRRFVLTTAALSSGLLLPHAVQRRLDRAACAWRTRGGSAA